MPKITKNGGASNVGEDREEARRNLAARGDGSPSREAVDAEVREIQQRRDASRHLAQPGETPVTPEHQAASSPAGGGAGEQDAVLPGVDPDEGGNPDGAGEFDPLAHTVDEVNDYLAGLGDDAAGDAERDRVLDAEEAGKARVGILGAADA